MKIKLAQEIAANAHGSIDQRRKYTKEPYINHPARVVEIISSVTDDENIVAAAWLHDVIEDVYPKNPEFSIELIREKLGEEVAQLVLEVTDVSKPSDGNRAKRKEIDRQHIAKASKGGKLIKLADLIDNTKDICANDPDFARVYLKEKRLLMQVLNGVNETLYAEAQELINQYSKGSSQ